MTEFNTIQQIKRRFFALRNGIIADALRRAGADYKMIFGLNLPQIAEVADMFPHTPELAEELWADRRTRESMLLAPMLYPLDRLDLPTAQRWLSEASTPEVADMLCHKLLRRFPQARTAALALVDSPDPMHRYSALRLLFNLLPSSTHAQMAETLAAARAEIDRNTPLTRQISAALADEIDFLTSEE